MRRRLLAFVLSATLAPALAASQDDSRQIWDSGFRQKRPASSSAGPTKTESARPDDRVTRPVMKVAAGTRVIGFTVWRLAPAAAGGNAPRLLVQDSPDIPGVEYVPQRMPAGARLRVGDRVRLGIEAAFDGYLYVINREQFADGSHGAPQLIFPARNLRDADNRIQPGRLVEIPGQTDRVPALRVQRVDPRSVGEELLVLVTSAPIPDLEIGSGDTPVAEVRVLDWERRWSRKAARLDLSTTDVTNWTTAEQRAGVSARLLTQDDPLPSSLYHVNADAEGVLVHIPLAVE